VISTATVLDDENNKANEEDDPDANDTRLDTETR
jgi:hypothetical protein